MTISKSGTEDCENGQYITSYSPDPENREKRERISNEETACDSFREKSGCESERGEARVSEVGEGESEGKAEKEQGESGTGERW